MISVSLCMIVRNEEKVIARCLDSVADLMDEIIIVDTGSSDHTKEIVSRYTNHIYDFEWIHDFAAARNFSFSHAAKDYICWLDADDVFLEKDRQAFLKLKNDLTSDYDTVLMDYVLSRDFQGNAQLFTRRNRLVKRARSFQWVNPVHEVLVVDGRALSSGIEVTHAPMREHKDPLRNISILEETIRKEQGNMSARVHFYYSNELMDHKRWDEAIDSYESFLRREVDYFEDHHAACGQLAHCYHAKGDAKKELQSLLKSFEYDLPRADICCRIAYWHEEHSDYEKAIFWYEMALTREMPPNHFGLMNKICWTWAPHVQLAICYGKLGQLDKACEHTEKALEYLPGDANLLANKSQLEGALRSLKAAETKAPAETAAIKNEGGG
ncbi:glycosyltransferase [Paenibacillus sepulcri]|uniref:Glycosyltransferase n=1 Tax=Paenibacillus sepulcri TaxID=359917 RepID=A0ABS7C9X7_9BACL|nr:glycosyltransferase [Paenibacillus sepulcri]